MVPSEIELILIANWCVEGWRRCIELSPKLNLVAEVSEAQLTNALDRFPNAAVVAIAADEGQGERLACELTRYERSGLIETPVSPVRALRWPSHDALQLAHGWVNLPARRWLAHLAATTTMEHARFDLAGTPRGSESELEDVIEQATALVVRLFPRAEVRHVEQPREGAVTVTFDGENTPYLVVTLSDHGHRFDVELGGAQWTARLSLEGAIERRWLERQGRQEERSRRVATFPERSLAQLLDPELLGDSLTTARAGWALGAQIVERLRYPVGVARRSLALAAQHERRSGVGLKALGLHGELQRSAPERLLQWPSRVSGLPLELLGVIAGIKPVAFLTVASPDLEGVLAGATAAGLAIERRERLVSVDVAQDAWDDRRDRGEPCTELYISCDPALAARTAALQADGDPSRSLSELGELLGYPSCCIEAFAAQNDRSNNTRNRYASWARTRGAGPWPWQLSNLSVMLTPFFPCRYDCPDALTYAKRSIKALDARAAGTVGQLAEALAHPTLYFTHGVSFTLHGGQALGDNAEFRVRGYTNVGLPRDGSPFAHGFAAWLASGDELSLTPTWLELRDQGRCVARFDRTISGLGFVAPFGP